MYTRDVVNGATIEFYKASRNHGDRLSTGDAEIEDSLLVILSIKPGTIV